MDRAVKTLKFLAFKEDDPKHRIIERCSIVECLCVSMAPTAILSVYLLWTTLMTHGLIAALFVYAAIVAATVEVPHIILDR